MKGIFLAMAMILVFVLSGCTTTGSRGPQNRRETNPFLTSRDGSPNEVLFNVVGEAPAVVEFRNWAGQLVQTWSERGDVLSSAGIVDILIDGKRRSARVRWFKVWLEEGSYQVTIRPFWYDRNHQFPDAVEGRVRRTSFSVDDKCDTYHEITDSYWGEVVEIDSGKVSRGRSRGLFGINITGTGLPGLLIKKWGERRENR